MAETFKLNPSNCIFHLSLWRVVQTIILSVIGLLQFVDELIGSLLTQAPKYAFKSLLFALNNKAHYM